MAKYYTAEMCECGIIQNGIRKDTYVDDTCTLTHIAPLINYLPHSLPDCTFLDWESNIALDIKKSR